MAAVQRDTSDYFDEVDIMATSAMTNAKKKPFLEQPDSPALRLLGSTAIDSTSALDTFLNDILNLGDAATVAAAAAAGLSATPTADRLDEDESSMSVLERRRLRRPKHPERMAELLRKLLADWSRHAGVLGVICVNTDGRVLLTDMQDNVAREMAGRFHQLMPMVRKCIKQIDADDELELMRFRTQNYEVLATTENGYTMLVVSVSMQYIFVRLGNRLQEFVCIISSCFCKSRIRGSGARY